MGADCIWEWNTFHHVIKFIRTFKVDFYGKSWETSHAWILRVMEGTNRKFRESSLCSEHFVFVPHRFFTEDWDGDHGSSERNWTTLSEYLINTSAYQHRCKLLKSLKGKSKDVKIKRADLVVTVN